MNDKFRELIDLALGDVDSIPDEDLKILDPMLNKLTGIAKKHHLNERSNERSRRNEIERELESKFKEILETEKP